MPIVFVHGIPETAEVWDLLAARLAEAGHGDQVRLSPPGFGAPVPEGFGATVTEYRDWLIAELEKFHTPVDLVAHDLGGGLAVMAAMARPDLIRSWCSDAVGLFDPDYVWHQFAKIWQTPVIGEGSIAVYKLESPKKRAAPQIAMGMDPVIGTCVAAAFDDAMGKCILRMYRSAVQPVMANLGTDLEAAAKRPGLLIMPSEDHAVGTDVQRQRSAARAGARVEVLTGLGHFWMTQDEGRPGANAIAAFLSSVDRAIPTTVVSESGQLRSTSSPGVPASFREGTKGVGAAVDPIADLSYKEEFNMNSWFIFGHFDNGGRKLNFLYHIIVSAYPDVGRVAQGVFSITDETTKRYIGGDIVVPGSAEATSGQSLDLKLANGSITGDLQNLRVTAKMDGGSVDVSMSATSPVLNNGGTGIFPMLGMTVYEYSIPRLKTTGTITLDGQSFAVDGVSWFDRQWQNFNVVRGQPIPTPMWTWMGIILDDGDANSLWSFYDHELERTLAWATILGADGSQTTTPIEPTSKSATDYWSSTVSGARYPTRWKVEIPEYDAVLEVVPSPREQEIVSTRPGLNRYEGASAISGTYRGNPVHGSGYVELVGPWK